MKSFDEILKEGKSKVDTKHEGTKKWREYVKIVLDGVHKLNDLHKNNKQHHVRLEQHNCKKCNVVSFVLAFRDPNNSKMVVRSCKPGWQVIEKGVYHCEKCKKGK